MLDIINLLVKMILDLFENNWKQQTVLKNKENVLLHAALLRELVPLFKVAEFLHKKNLIQLY